MLFLFFTPTIHSHLQNKVWQIIIFFWNSVPLTSPSLTKMQTSWHNFWYRRDRTQAQMLSRLVLRTPAEFTPETGFCFSLIHIKCMNINSVACLVLSCYSSSTFYKYIYRRYAIRTFLRTSNHHSLPPSKCNQPVSKIKTTVRFGKKAH